MPLNTDQQMAVEHLRTKLEAMVVRMRATQNAELNEARSMLALAITLQESDQ